MTMDDDALADMERALLADEGVADADQTLRLRETPVAAVVRVDGTQTSVWLRRGTTDDEASLEALWQRTWRGGGAVP